jgi:hypothetical protein
VEKFGMSNTGDSTINQKAIPLFPLYFFRNRGIKMDRNNSETKQGAVVPAGSLQQKTSCGGYTHIVPPLAARISRRRLVAKVGKYLKLHAYNFNFLGLGGIAARNWWRGLERL